MGWSNRVIGQQSSCPAFKGSATELVEWWDAQVKNNKIDELIKSRDAAIGINAKWQLLIRGKETRDKLRVREVSEFVGFLEGRLLVRLPEWWARRLKSNSSQRFDMGVTAINSEREEVSVAEERGKTFVTDGKRKSRVMFDTTRSDSSPLFAYDKNHVFVGKIDNFFESYEIVSVVRKTGKVKWRSRVTTCFIGMPAIIGVGPGHKAEMLIESNRVFVFGSYGRQAYLQSFSVLDGSVQAWWDVDFSWMHGFGMASDADEKMWKLFRGDVGK